MSVTSNYWILEWSNGFEDSCKMQDLLTSLFGGHTCPTDNAWLCYLEQERSPEGHKIWKVWLSIEQPKSFSNMERKLNDGVFVKPSKIVPLSYFSTKQGNIPVNFSVECIRGQPYVQYNVHTDWAAIGAVLASEAIDYSLWGAMLLKY